MEEIMSKTKKLSQKKSLVAKINFIKLLVLVIVFTASSGVIKAQADSGIRQIASFNPTNYYAANPLNTGNTSGDGRFLVFESNQDIATFNPRNSDKNWEVFLMDNAQRHIFQITNTKNALQNVNGSPTENANIVVLITNLRADISNDGKWITFASNATTSTPTNQNGTNPGNFDGNATGNPQVLQQDGNLEIWLYQIPSYTQVDMSTGDTPTFVNLGTGTFTPATNTPALPLPQPGSTNFPPSIATNNDFPSIDDNGETIAFISDRDIVAGGNSYPNDDNLEVFVYKRPGGQSAQVTRTPRNVPFHVIFQSAASISGDGRRVSFMSNTTNPVIGMSGGCNPEFNPEAHFSDLNTFGEPDGIRRQITITNPVDSAPTVQLLTSTRSISRNGRYVIFYSRARHTGDGGIETYFASFLYDSETTPPATQCQSNSGQFRQIGPRFNTDTILGITGFFNSPTFTDYDVNRQPGSIVFQSRMNFRPDGTVPTIDSEGLNPSSSRPNQIFAFSIPAPSNPFSRLTNAQNINWGTATRVYPTNTKRRINFTTGSQNPDSLSLFHMITPAVLQEEPSNTVLRFATGASAMWITSSPPLAQGLTPNMLGTVTYLSELVDYSGGFATQVSNSRNFAAPVQLKGTTLTIDGISANLTRAYNGQINFIVPPGLTAGTKNVVVNDKGIVLRGTVQIIQSPQPDIVTNYTETTPTSFGWAKILNVTDPNNPQPQPFTVITQTPSGPMPTKLRIFITGVEGVTAGSINITLGNITVPTSSVSTNAIQADYPGVFTFDFEVPQQLDGAGNIPVVVNVTHNGQPIQSRPVQTASRTYFNPLQAAPTDLAVWRPSSGTWYILDNYGANPIYMPWGINTDVPAPGDYDGDGKTDFCIFRPAAGDWYIYKSSNNSILVYHFGLNGDKVAQADYDADGKTDIAVYRPSSGVWYISKSSNGQVTSEYFGVNEENLVPADFDGDGKADLAVWRNAQASFWVKGSVQNSLLQTNFGQSGDKPVVGDYDGDGKADFATWRSSDNKWRILNSSDTQLTETAWGTFATDMPVQGDYDGDGMTDIAVWRSSGSQAGWWFIRKSSNGQTRAEAWGVAGDIPVPAPW